MRDDTINKELRSQSEVHGISLISSNDSKLVIPGEKTFRNFVKDISGLFDFIW